MQLEKGLGQWMVVVLISSAGGGYGRMGNCLIFSSYPSLLLSCSHSLIGEQEVNIQTPWYKWGGSVWGGGDRDSHISHSDLEVSKG